MDETYIKINGQWRYLYRAVDKAGQTIDFLLTAHRDKKAALRFLKKAIRHHGLPDKVTIDKSGTNTAALEALQEETNHPIEKRQSKYLNNGIEVRFVDPKPSSKRVWGMGPKSTGGNQQWLENLMSV